MKKILRFTASWCNPCKVLAKNLEEADVGVPIEVVDVDVHPELAEQYAIRGIPSLVLVDGDTRVATKVGVYSAEQIKSWVLLNS